MALLVLTGGARSGKSAMAAKLAASRGEPVTVAVSGATTDEEMRRRIERHRRERAVDWRTLELGADPARELSSVGDDECLVVDCLGAIVGRIVAEECRDEGDLTSASTEEATEKRVDAVVASLLERGGDTIVVTNEVGAGVVPSHPAGRLFRDALGRANRDLVSAAEGAWLVIAGRCLDLRAQREAAGWPTE